MTADAGKIPPQSALPTSSDDLLTELEGQYKDIHAHPELSMQESTGLPYASRASGTDRFGQATAIAHACGHDMHVAWLMAATRLLAEHRQQWTGTVMAVFQPGEETGQGARHDRGRDGHAFPEARRDSRPARDAAQRWPDRLAHRHDALGRG
jgi:metal-dependent amidase/aminoacylase/carboxypeptidase family protein